MKALPQIAIVGRPNVGKSAIFNRLAGRRIAIVHDQPGVTRDRIAAEVTIGDGPDPIQAELTDTGGIGTALDDGFTEQVRFEADIAIAAADLILFVVDAREGLTPTDETLAAVLRKADRKVILVANKADTEKTDPATAEFSKLGFDEVLRVSAAHGRHFGYLEDVIRERLADFDAPEIFDADAPEAEVEPIKIAIVGRPNVGKSSLINAIMRDERSIVSDVAGTTRDAVDVPYEREGESYLLIDTAGIRRRGNRDTSVEVFSVMRSERTIRRADICLLVIDASSGVVGQDRRIAKLIIEAQKPCIVLLNKFDLYHPEAHFQDRIDQFRDDLGEDLFFLPYAPKVAISAKNRQYLSKIFGAIDEVKKAAEEPIPTGLLNRLLSRSIELNPPPVRRMKRLKLLYATQKRHDKPGRIPVPEYLLFVNYSNLLTRTYERFLENKMRDKYPMEGLPFVFNVKQRQTRDREDGKGSAGARVSAKGNAKPKRSTKGKGRGVRK